MPYAFRGNLVILARSALWIGKQICTSHSSARYIQNWLINSRRCNCCTNRRREFSSSWHTHTTSGKRQVGSSDRPHRNTCCCCCCLVANGSTPRLMGCLAGRERERVRSLSCRSPDNCHITLVCVHINAATGPNPFWLLRIAALSRQPGRVLNKHLHGIRAKAAAKRVIVIAQTSRR